MDIAGLINNSDLTSALMGLDPSDASVGALGRELGGQLSGGDGFDLSDLLASLDADAFLPKIDVAAVAETVGISPQFVSGALALIAPQVAEFMGAELTRPWVELVSWRVSFSTDEATTVSLQSRCLC